MFPKLWGQSSATPFSHIVSSALPNLIVSRTKVSSWYLNTARLIFSQPLKVKFLFFLLPWRRFLKNRKLKLFFAESCLKLAKLPFYLDSLLLQFWPACLSVSLPVYLFVFLKVCLSLCLFICLSFLNVCLSLCLSVSLSVCLFVYVSICIHVCVYLFVFLNVSLSMCLCVCLSWMSVWVCVCMYGCVSVCVFCPFLRSHLPKEKRPNSKRPSLSSFLAPLL
jgi:hypothetical protein